MKISLIVLSSIDGMIARDQNDDLSWGSSEDKNFFRTKTKEIGTMIMGSSTFEKMPDKAFSDRFSLVMTSDVEKYKNYTNGFGKVEFFTGLPEEAVELLETRGIGKAALIGGGKINNAFLKSGLVDEIYLTIAPKIFGDGVRGFGIEKLDVDLQLLELTRISDGEILFRYKVVK